MKKYISEVESVLQKLPKRTSAQNPEAYIGGGQSKLKYIGLKVPDLRSTMKNGFSFYQEEQEDIARIWDYIWHHSDTYEVMSLALIWFEGFKDHKELKKYWPLLKKWSSRIDNWAHSDGLCGIYARIFEHDPGLFKTFSAWNRSKNPWLRRISLVSLFYYSSQRDRVPPLPKVISLLKPQLDYDHYYVQKGIGWTLREAGNIYPNEVYAFIETHIHRIRPEAYSAATEKMPTKKREYLKSLRKNRKK